MKENSSWTQEEEILWKVGLFEWGKGRGNDLIYLNFKNKMR